MLFDHTYVAVEAEHRARELRAGAAAHRLAVAAAKVTSTAAGTAAARSARAEPRRTRPAEAGTCLPRPAVG